MIVAAAPSRLRNVDTSPTSRYTLDLGASSLSVPGDVATGRSASARTTRWLPTRDEIVRGTVEPPTRGFVYPY